MNNLSKGTKCRISQTVNVNLDGDTIECYDDNLGDIVEIIRKEIERDDIVYYEVNNLTKGYEQYVPSTILELV